MSSAARKLRRAMERGKTPKRIVTRNPYGTARIGGSAHNAYRTTGYTFIPQSIPTTDNDKPNQR